MKSNSGAKARSAVIVVVAIAAGCRMGGSIADGRLDSRTRGPLVLAVDSVLLAEPDSAPMGNRTRISEDSHGTIYATDVSNGRILIFGADGRFSGVIGKQGSGPGEFESPGAVEFLAGDSLIAVMDVGRLYLSIFDRRSRAFLRGVMTRFRDVGFAWSTSADSVSFAVHPDSALLATWAWRGDSIITKGRIPDRLRTAGLFYLAYGRPEVIPADSGFLARVPTEPGLWMLDRSGRTIGTLRVPSARRRGVGDDLIARQRAEKAKGAKFRYLGSVVAGLGRLSTGEVALLDVDLDDQGIPGRREHVNLRYYLTLLSRDLSKVCVDGEIPFRTDEPTNLPVMMGNRILGLSRIVTPDNKISTLVYHYRIDSTPCEWRSLDAVTPVSAR